MPTTRFTTCVSGAGVVTADDLSKSPAIDVRVDLRRPDVRMAEQFLHDAKIGTACEQVCGKAVSKHVGMGVFDLGADGRPADDLPDGDTLQRTARR